MELNRSEFLKKLGLSLLGFSSIAKTSLSAAEEIVAPRAIPVTPQPSPPSATTSTNTPNLVPAPAPPSGEYELNAHFVSSGPGFGNRLAITFDDGPTPGVTEKVLAALKERDLRATFFMIGQRVEAYPDLAKKVLDGGHEIGNHSFTHPKLSSMSDMSVSLELERCQEAVVKATGYRPVWCRPPYGAFKKSQGRLALALGLGVTYWSVDPRDWSQPGVATIIDRVTKGARPGSIILCHDLHQQTADAVDQILDDLLKRQFEFINISGFLGQPYAT